MNPVATCWHVSAFRAPGDGSAADAVARVRELRARILFDGGRRPAFRGPDGAFVDEQELDHGAWHFIARRDKDGPPLGYVRLLTPHSGEHFQTRSFLGATRHDAMLRGRGARSTEIFEHGRLVVEPRARKLGLGVHLNAAAIGAARVLGAAAMTGTSGTADGQDAFHARFGFVEVPGTRRYVEHYTEDVLVMMYETARGAGEHEDLVARLCAEFPAMVEAGEREFGAAGTLPPVHGGRPEPATLGRLAARGTGAGAEAVDAWRPVLLRPAREADRKAFTELLDSGTVHQVNDTMDDQLTELVRSREPGRSLDGAGLRRAKDEQLCGLAPWEYGTWAFYPWSGRLVHALPREEFRLVRTDRNRGKIDRPEQRRLLDRRIGVVGLSVGNSAALTMALEGLGGAFRLADFDELGLSNLNRLRAGVHDLGVNKAVLAARQMFEIDPYLDIEVFTGGLTDDCAERFFTGGRVGEPLDLLVEECDTPYIKLAAREHARAHRIPVVMDANDRGLLDVERFDLEPDRPLLHGLLGDTRAADLVDLDRERTVELILAMVQQERLSPELRGSIPEIGRTLSSWPQLASGVALGGALCAEAARRILLGRTCASGRYYTDLETTIRPEASTVRVLEPVEAGV